MRKAFILLFIIAVAMPLFAQPAVKTGEKEGTVDTEWFAAQVKKGIPSWMTVVDVRTVKENAAGATKGVLNIPVALFDGADACSKISAQLPKGKPVVFICPNGPRAEEMYFNLTDPVKDGGCGLPKQNMYWLYGKVSFQPLFLDVTKKFSLF